MSQALNVFEFSIVSLVVNVLDTITTEPYTNTQIDNQLIFHFSNWSFQIEVEYQTLINPIGGSSLDTQGIAHHLYLKSNKCSS